MKIQIFTESFIGYDLDISEDVFGGQELLLLKMCEVLLCNGHDISVIQFGNNDKNFTYKGIKIKQVKAPKLNLIQRLGFIRRWTWAGVLFLKHFDEKAEWIHLHNHHFSFPLVFLKKKNQIMTGMNHGVEWDIPWVYKYLTIKNLKERFSFFLLKKITNFSVSRLDKIMTNDRFFIHFTTLKKPHFSYKFNYIPNFFEKNLLFTTKNDSLITEEIKKFSDNKPLVYLPKMSIRERGTDFMIRACSSQNKWKLIISGVSHDQKIYENYAKSLNSSKKIFFTGHISRGDQSNLYNLADIVVVPSPCREATAIAALEAMAFGKPLIAAEIGGLVEIIWHEHNGLLCEANEIDFSKNINLLLNDKDLAQRISENAKRDVFERFSFERWEKLIISFFSKENN